jgi:predicted small lipoprotein YifL
MRWLLLTLILLQAANCGQTGPLRLPEQDTLAPRIQSERSKADASYSPTGAPRL